MATDKSFVISVTFQVFPISLAETNKRPADLFGLGRREGAIEEAGGGGLVVANAPASNTRRVQDEASIGE